VEETRQNLNENETNEPNMQNSDQEVTAILSEINKISFNNQNQLSEEAQLQEDAANDGIIETDDSNEYETPNNSTTFEDLEFVEKCS